MGIFSDLTRWKIGILAIRICFENSESLHALYFKHTTKFSREAFKSSRDHLRLFLSFVGLPGFNL